ncbi:MAG: STAS domain-containing protein [Spirochaetaceae bacterium]|jgi:anti-anti-sigma factor|nr:STAS domain-containing protein [Spirochaetaceae bacterium]
MENISIETKKDGDLTIAAVSGRLDANTGPYAQEKLFQIFDSAKNIELDLSSLEYISSAGIRVLLGIKKRETAIGGSIVFSHVNSAVMEVFDLVGLTEFFTIKT